MAIKEDQPENQMCVTKLKGKIEDREAGLTRFLMRLEIRLEGLALKLWGLFHRCDDGREV